MTSARLHTTKNFFVSKNAGFPSQILSSENLNLISVSFTERLLLCWRVTMKASIPPSSVSVWWPPSKAAPGRVIFTAVVIGCLALRPRYYHLAFRCTVDVHSLALPSVVLLPPPISESTSSQSYGPLHLPDRFRSVIPT